MENPGLRGIPRQPASRKTHLGKAPPVDSFTGENPEVRLDDWLPTLERASTWNEWTEDELLLQLAGHLRGRALQEWNLIDSGSKGTYSRGTDSLRSRLDPGSRTLAAQDFRCTQQGEREHVADFIRKLERTFNIAYGRDGTYISGDSGYSLALTTPGLVKARDNESSSHFRSPGIPQVAVGCS